MHKCFFAISITLFLHTSSTKAALSESDMIAAADYSKSYRGQTIIVLEDSNLAFERYDNGGAADKLQMLASGSKSFVGLAAVAAVQDGSIELDGQVVDSIREWRNDPAKSQITYRQLLTLTSGLLASERALAVRAPSWQELANKPMTAQPGERFAYGANQLNVFAYALERELNNESFEHFLERRILDVIGVKVEWRYKCDDGHPQVGGGAFMTARDWATFGEFVRQQGNWRGIQVIDKKLVALCFQGTEQNPAYGLTWWLKKPVTYEIRRQIPILSSEWADVANSDSLPADIVAACGAGKQRLYVIPSLKLVVVRQGGLGQGFSDVKFLSLLLGRERSSN